MKPRAAFLRTTKSGTCSKRRTRRDYVYPDFESDQSSILPRRFAPPAALYFPNPPGSRPKASSYIARTFSKGVSGWMQWAGEKM
jgi:hypothetical protein